MTGVLAGKAAVVTGGSRGIGRAIVERLARDGASVVFNYRNREAEAHAVEEAVPGARAVRAESGFLAIQHAARHMRDGGRIVTVSTLNTSMAAPAGAGLYVGSKGALEQFTKVAAGELGVRGITANTVSPGATDTELLRSTNRPEQVQALLAWTPLRRLGQPADVADVVAFLAGPDGRWITGQNLHAGGGLG